MVVYLQRGAVDAKAVSLTMKSASTEIFQY